MHPQNNCFQLFYHFPRIWYFPTRRIKFDKNGYLDRNITADRTDCVRDGSRRGSRMDRQLPVPVPSRRGNSEQSAHVCRQSFLRCYRLNGSSLRSAPYDLLHRIALSPSTTHRRCRRGNVGYTTMGKTQRKRERERENESGKRDRATKMEGRLYGVVRKEAREDSLCLMILRRGELLAIYASSYVVSLEGTRE